MKIVMLLAIISWAAVSTACGQKGALVLPDAPRPHKKIALPKPQLLQETQPATPGPSAPDTGHASSP